MALVTTNELISEAATSGRAIGAFNVLHLETAEALAAGAEESGLPLILAISQNCIAYHGRPDAIIAATLAVARASTARLSVHLDHVEDESLAERGLELGASSVMFDASRLPYDENVALTAAVAERAHARGATIEGELGEVGGKDGAHAPGVRTDPDEARAFVAATGIDTLAVAVGTTHARTTRDATIDLDLIERLAASAGVPLVLHGSSSLDDAALGDATAHGITKVNISTHLNGAFTGAVRAWLAENPSGVDSRRYLGAGREAIAAESARLQRLLAARPHHA
jgi:fructose-bisphosphate aldolase class II